MWGVVLAALLTTSLMASEVTTSTGAKESCWPGEPGTDPDLCPPNDPTYPGRWEFRSDIPQAFDRRNMHPR